MFSAREDFLERIIKNENDDNSWAIISDTLDEVSLLLMRNWIIFPIILIFRLF